MHEGTQRITEMFKEGAQCINCSDFCDCNHIEGTVVVFLDRC